MEISVQNGFGGQFQGRRVLVTGHSGFKGGWLCHWLNALGADLVGVALPPPPGPSLFERTGLAQQMDSRMADITDAGALGAAVGGLDAEVLFHLAAQPFVRRSYREPATTFTTNVTGTAHVLDLARHMPSLKAIVVVTSDKCYENNEWVWGYRENDPMGGADPYSASKGCTELVTQSYRRSFFADPEGPQLATARAGNVFGGGDWGEDRLIPDIIRAEARGEEVEIRAPEAIRPWQHVLEPLSGYLMLAARLLQDGAAFAGAWNFGPSVQDSVPVRALVGRITRAWGDGAPQITMATHTAGNPHEAGVLRLDSTKAHNLLGWAPRWTLDQAVRATVDWHTAEKQDTDVAALTRTQIQSYCAPPQSDHRNPTDMAAQ